MEYPENSTPFIKKLQSYNTKSRRTKNQVLGKGSQFTHPLVFLLETQKHPNVKTRPTKKTRTTNQRKGVAAKMQTSCWRTENQKPLVKKPARWSCKSYWRNR